MQDRFTKVLLLGAGALIGVLATTTLVRQEPAQAQAQAPRTGAQPAAPGGGAMPAGATQPGSGSVAVGVSGPYVFIVHGRGNDVGTYVYHCDPATRQVMAVTPVNPPAQR